MHARLQLQSAAETIDADRMIVQSVISTSEPDRAGDVVEPLGLRNAGEFLANPVVLWAHQRGVPPIGTCLDLQVLPDRIVARTKFAAASPLAADIFRLYRDGVLRGWSIGFLPVRSVPIRGGGSRVEQWDLLEYSAVPVPENPRALTLAVEKGVVRHSNLLRWLMRQTDVLANLLRA